MRNSHAPTIDRESELQIATRKLASFLPIFIIGYSALIDPLINFDPTPKLFFGGLQIGAIVKSTIATKVIVPALFLVTLLLALIAPIKYPRAMNMVSLPMIGYFSLALLSVLWSRDAANTMTLAVYQIILCSSLFLAIGVANNPSRIMRNLLWLFFFVILTNILFTVIQPPGPIGHQGIYGYKNTLGAVAGCALIIAIFHLTRVSYNTQIVAWITLAASIYLLIVSESKTAMIMALAAPIIAIVWLSLSKLFQVRLFVSALFAMMAVGATYIILSSIFYFDSRDLSIFLFGDDTFTGRTHVWEFVVGHIIDGPFYGQGYRGFWGVGAESPSNYAEIEFIRIAGSSHNGFLDALLDLGVFGLSLQIVFVLAIFSACGKKYSAHPIGSTLLMAIAIFVVGRNMMETVIFWSTIFDNLLIISIGLVACLTWNQSAGTEDKS